MRLTLAVLVAAALAAPAAVGGGSSPPRPTEALVVPTGRAPCGSAARAGSLWVAVYETGMLLRIGRSGRVEARLRVGSSPCRVAVGPSAVWVTRDLAGEVVRIALGSGRRQRLAVGRGAFDVLLAGGSIWATSFDVGTVARMDPASGALRRVFRGGVNPAGLAACGGLVWVGHGRSATALTSIDPATNRLRHVPVGAASPGWPHCIGGTLWVTTPDSVLRLDARTGKVLSRLEIGETLAHAAAGPDGLIWVTDKQHSVVHRVHPNGRSVVDSFPAGPGAFALTPAGGSMWVTSFAGTDVRRYDLS